MNKRGIRPERKMWRRFVEKPQASMIKEGREGKCRETRFKEGIIRGEGWEEI